MGIWDLRYRYPDLVRVQGKTLPRTGVRINMQAMPNQKENPLYSKVSKATAQKKTLFPSNLQGSHARIFKGRETPDLYSIIKP